MCLQSSSLEVTGNTCVVYDTNLCKCNWEGGEWEGWEETELGWPLLDTAQQGCAGSLALPCPTVEGQLSLSFPGGSAEFGALLHLGTLSADGAGEVSSALPSHLPPLTLG